MNNDNDHIKRLEEMRDAEEANRRTYRHIAGSGMTDLWQGPTRRIAAIDFALSAIARLREYEEMLEAANEIHFGPGTYIVRLGKKPYEYGVKDGYEVGRGDHISWLEAFAEIKKQENKGETDAEI